MSEKPTKGFGFAAIVSKSRCGITCAGRSRPEGTGRRRPRVGEEAVEVGGAVARVPGDEVVAGEHVLGELDAVALRLHHSTLRMTSERLS